MSKFDILAHGELNRYSALNLKLALDEYVNSQGDAKSIHLADTKISISFGSNDKITFLNGKLHKIVANDDAVFLIKLPITQSEDLSVNDVRKELYTISKSNDKSLIIVDLSSKMLHQVLDHRSTNNKAIYRKRIDNNLILIIDRGDHMSDELVIMWNSFKSEP